MNKTIAIIAGASMAITGSAMAASFTFDLSNYILGSTQVQFGTQNVGAGGMVVTGIEWNITYQGGAAVGSGSWTNELSMELVGPSGSANPVLIGIGAPGGHYVQTAGQNAGTFIWGDVNNPWVDLSLHSPGSTPNSHGWQWQSSTTYVGNSAGTSGSLNGQMATGTWTLNLFDSYNDTGSQGAFSAGSYITVNYIPAPAGLAALGLVGLIAARRRR